MMKTISVTYFSSVLSEGRKEYTVFFKILIQNGSSFEDFKGTDFSLRHLKSCIYNFPQFKTVLKSRVADRICNDSSLLYMLGGWNLAFLCEMRINHLHLFLKYVHFLSCRKLPLTIERSQQN